MATVGTPKFGVKITYKNGAVTTIWRSTEEARDAVHARLNNPVKSPDVQTAKRVSR